MAGTSSSVIFSYSGNQYASVSGGEVQYPPDGSGFRLQPTNPSSRTHRSSSATQSSSGHAGTCGSWHTPAKFRGNSVVTRPMRSLQARAQARAVAGSVTWCPIADAWGEKIVRSVPRSPASRSWLASMLSRISSSLIAPGTGGAGAGSVPPAHPAR